jgi:MFS family permease
VMMLIMTMTPLHMTDHGHGLTAVGTVISGHVFGMFALAPLSGRLTDRFGPLPIISAGMLLLLTAAVGAALAPPDSQLLLMAALFLLGWGWNLGTSPARRYSPARSRSPNDHVFRACPTR